MTIETWQQKRDWLQTTFNDAVITTWHGPGRYMSRMDHTEICVDGQPRSAAAMGTSGEDSVCHLFEKLTHLGAGGYVVHDGGRYSSVNAETLNVTPLRLAA